MPKGRPKVSRVKVTCANCGKEVEKYLLQVQQNKSGRFFCSQACRMELGRPKTIPRRNCEWCGVEFVSYDKTPGSGRFCSKEHYDEWQRRNRVERTCERCGKRFDLPPTFKTRQVGRFCSVACASDSRIKRRLDRQHNGKPAVLDRNGYVRVYAPDHPRATKGGWQFEHRIVAEEALGRYLEPDEHVHHLNGKKDDNRSENLIVMGDREHLLLSSHDYRTEIRSALAELAEYRRRYGPLEDE